MDEGHKCVFIGTLEVVLQHQTCEYDQQRLYSRMNVKCNLLPAMRLQHLQHLKHKACKPCVLSTFVCVTGRSSRLPPSAASCARTALVKTVAPSKVQCSAAHNTEVILHLHDVGDSARQQVSAVAVRPACPQGLEMPFATALPCLL